MFRQVANPASERQQAATAGRGVFPESTDIVCGQQRADGDITLRTNEEVGEPEPEESGQGKAVSGLFVVCEGRWRIYRESQESFVTGCEGHQETISFG